jgi:hypothetical protein
MPQAMPIENDNSVSRFSVPAAHRKKLTAAFDGGRLTSDDSVLLLAQADLGMSICNQLAGCIADRRDHTRVIYTRAPGPHIADVQMPHGVQKSEQKLSDANQPDIRAPCRR